MHRKWLAKVTIPRDSETEVLILCFLASWSSWKPCCFNPKAWSHKPPPSFYTVPAEGEDTGSFQGRSRLPRLGDSQSRMLVLLFSGGSWTPDTHFTGCLNLTVRSPAWHFHPGWLFKRQTKAQETCNSQEREPEFRFHSCFIPSFLCCLLDCRGDSSWLQLHEPLLHSQNHPPPRCCLPAMGTGWTTVLCFCSLVEKKGAGLRCEYFLALFLTTSWCLWTDTCPSGGRQPDGSDSPGTPQLLGKVGSGFWLNTHSSVAIFETTPYKTISSRPPHKNTELWMLFGSRHRAAHCSESLRASVLYVSFPALLLSGRLVFFIFSMVLMQGFILEVFLNIPGTERTRISNSLELQQKPEAHSGWTLFPHGRGAGGAETKEWTHLPLPSCAHEARGALLGQRPLALQDKVLSPESEVGLLTPDRHTRVQARAGWSTQLFLNSFYWLDRAHWRLCWPFVEGKARLYSPAHWKTKQMHSGFLATSTSHQKWLRNRRSLLQGYEPGFA